MITGEFEEVRDEHEITLQQQIACVERELGMRRSVYAHRVGLGKMRMETAHYELEAMKAVLQTLKKLQEVEHASTEHK